MPTPPLKTPIRLTCTPRFVDGACIHILGNGACELPDQLMCPFALAHFAEHPQDAQANVTPDVLAMVRARTYLFIDPPEKVNALETPKFTTTRKKPAVKAAKRAKTKRA